MKIRSKFCPKCRSLKINGVIGGSMGFFECYDCKFRSVIFPEREINTEEVKTKCKT